MTAIERTAYPRFTRAPSVKELREMYTPTPGDIAFVATRARGPSQKFALMILLKVYQRLHYFPDPQGIPGAVISHIRAVMKLPADLVPDIAPATLYRYYMALREYLEITTYQGKQVRHVAAHAMRQAAQVMNNPADIINAAIETLLNEHCELPAFSTLDRLARRIRTLVNGGIYQRILARLSDSERQALSTLLQQEESSPFTPFNRIKEPPKSATLTHLDEWLSRLTWLQSLGNTSHWLEEIRSNKIIHLAEEAHSLHASDFSDFLPPKRFALLVCLIHHETIQTRDQIVEMFIKRMSKLTCAGYLEHLFTKSETCAEIISLVSHLDFTKRCRSKKIGNRQTPVC